MTHVIHQPTSQFTRVALLGLLLAVAALALFGNITSQQTAAAQGASAQPTPTPQRFQVAINHIKPEMVTDYEAYLKNDTLPAFRKAGGKQWSTWRTDSLGETAEYVVVRPTDGLKEFDEPDYLTKSLGAAGRQAIVAKFRRMLVSRHTFIVQMRPELSIPPKTNDAPKLAIVYRTKVAFGRGREYEDNFKNFTLPWLRQGEQFKALLTSKVTMGGDSNEYFGAFWLDSFTDMGKWMGSLGRAANSNNNSNSTGTNKNVGIILSQESAVYRYVPELSIWPTAQNAAK